MYFYDIAASTGGVIQDSLGNTIIVQNTNSISDDAMRYISAVNAGPLINTGAAAVEVFERRQTAGETLPALSQRLLADHDARQTWWIQNQREHYAQSGIGASST